MICIFVCCVGFCVSPCGGIYLLISDGIKGRDGGGGGQGALGFDWPSVWGSAGHNRDL